MSKSGVRTPLAAADAEVPTYDAAISNTKKGGAVGVAGSGIPPICLCILGVELCERLAFYTFTGTQEFFLEHLGYSLSAAGGINAAMGTLCTVWALYAGWTADVVFGRYRTILLCGLLYTCGAAVAAASAWPTREKARWYLAGVMVLIPMGTAGIKANISNFGADQYDTSDPVQAAAQEKFFSWFYLSINLGSAVAYGYLTTLGSNGGMGVPKQYGYFCVYVVAAVCMFGAVMAFRAGKPYYRTRPVMQTSPFGSVARHLVAASRSGSARAGAFCCGMVLLLLGVVLSVAGAMLPGASIAGMLTYAAFIFTAAGMAMVVIPSMDPKRTLQDWKRDGEQTVQLPEECVSCADVEDFVRLLPVLFTANLAFGCLYNSMQFWYQQQACQMDVRMPFSADNSQFAGSFFCIADCLGIVVATPIALGYLNPFLERASGGRFDHSVKYGLGMLFAAASVAIACRIEQLRRAAPLLPMTSNCAPAGIHMSDLSAAWMFLPFFLMGLGEIYTQPILMHFSYTNSPASMRTLTAATGLVIGAVSNCLFTVQIAALSPFVPNDLNKGHLEYGYYANIVIGAVFYVLCVGMMQRFEARRLQLA